MASEGTEMKVFERELEDTDALDLIRDDDDDPKGQTEIGDFVAFGTVVNAIVGTGFFAVPHTFKHAGMIFSIILISFCSIFSILAALWTLEMTSRARGWDFAKRHNIRHKAEMNKMTFHQIEYTGVGKIFAGRGGAIFVQVVMSLYAFGSLWAYCSMFASTGANLVQRYFFMAKQECIVENVHTDECHMSYELCLLIFAFIVLAVEIFGMGALAHFQMFFTVYRFVAFGLIIVSCFISLGFNGAYWIKDSTDPLNPSPPWYAFQMNYFDGLFSAASFALLCCYNLPNVLTPMKKGKKNAGKVVTAAIIICGVLYIGVASLVSLTLGDDVLQFVILNWANFGTKGFYRPSQLNGTSAPSNWFSTLIKLIIMLFPMMNLISSFPLVAGTAAFNLYSTFPQTWKDRLGDVGSLIFKYVVSLVPFILAAFFSSLGLIIKFCGLFSIFLGCFIPAFFEWFSRRKTRNEKKTPYDGWWSHTWLVIVALLYGGFAFVYNIILFVMSAIKGN